MPPGAPAAARGKSPPAARLTMPAPARVGRCRGEPTGHHRGLPIAVRVLVAGAAERPPEAIYVPTRVPRVGGRRRATRASSAGTVRPLRRRTAVPIGGDLVSRVIVIAPRPVRRRSRAASAMSTRSASDQPPPRNSRLTGDRRTVNRFVLSSVDAQVRLTIAVQIELGQRDPAFYRMLENGRRHVPAVPGHVAGKSGVQARSAFISGKFLQLRLVPAI